MVTVSQITPIPISSLDDATTLTGNEAMPMVQNNQTVQAPVNQLPQGMSAGVIVYGDTGGAPFPNFRTLNAGEGIQITDSGEQNDLTISLSAGGNTAPATASYVVMGASTVLDHERILAVSSSLSLTDGGANSTATIGTQAISGDVTSSANSLATTLATVNSNVGSFIKANITVNAKGLVTAVSSGTDAVISVSGTTNRITSTGGTSPVVDISGSYVGQSSITTLGTIGTGVWQGTLVGPTYGGTGVNNGSNVLTIGASASVSGTNTGDQTSISGNAGTATALQNARTIGGVSFNGTANIVPQTIQSVAEAADTTCFPLFISASGSQSLQPLNSTGFTFNANTSNLGATTFTGALAGNASTAATLQTPRTINGTSFNGSANITVTAAASTLTGAITGYTPTISSSVGSITTSSASGNYYDVGNVRFFDMAITITTNGTGAGTLYATLPSTPAVNSITFASGRENGITGALMFGFNNTSDSKLSIQVGASLAYPGASGASITMSGWYRLV